MSLQAFPWDALIDVAESLPFHRIDHFDERNLAVKVGAEVRPPIAILTLGPAPDTIRQHRFQLIKVTPHDVHFFVGDKSGQMLPHTLPHHSRLAVIHSQTLFLQDSAYRHIEPFDTPCKIVVSRKREVVRISRIGRSGGFR